MLSNRDVPRQTCVYVLRSTDQPHRYYTGLTSNLETRLNAHNDGLSRHRSSGRPWRIVVSLTFADEDAAKRFEAYLKSGSGRAFAVRHFK